jgi:hypothetical protein
MIPLKTAKNLFDLFEALINSQFPQICLSGPMNFDGSGHVASFRVAFSSEDDTMNTKAESLGEAKLMLRGVCLSILCQELFHDCGRK